MEAFEFLNTMWRSLPSVLIVLLYVIALWFTFDRMTRFNDRNEIVFKGNLAYLLQRLGLVAAQVIAMLAVIPGYDPAHIWTSLGWLLAEGLWVFVALVLARWFVDWLILPKIKNEELLLKHNLGVGLAEAGAYIGIGILLAGSLTGNASNLGVTVASTVVFYALGLLLVTAVFWLYEWVTPYSLRTLLQQGDVAAGIELAGVFVATALAVRVGVAGDLETWGSALAWFAITAAAAIVTLGIVYACVLTISAMVWRIPKGQRRNAPNTAIASLRAGSMVLASAVVSTIISIS